ncbi:fimbria/pilus outer membrane usher protein [Enterobacillus tribolii]|uniref:Outer membrane usher protein n=1 Tax=Enterobacillus tribolii TaxID=1487935 RepID=A0A370QP00_9GAMM|nr:fimbria/pilus outer membrane usher protein [Enterobacillus tribolii]MBW7981907.1 fimbrial biogenesis outer membrane usher protein [Enterobacillus tribolii]RDK90072.1 outer membrane usher protein [Enterobacillus tribolii]
MCIKNNTPPGSRRWRLNRLACFIAAQLTLPGMVMSDALARDYFNPALLELGGGNGADLSAFEEKGGQLPGTYRVDVFLNNEKVDTRDVEFRMMKDGKGKETLQPCIPVADLKQWGVKTDFYPQLGAPGDACANITSIELADADFRFGQQQLVLSFPQSAVKSNARGWVDPKMWDDGIPAVLLNYSVSGANNYAKSGKGYDSDSQFVNLRPGINIGPWRLRNYTTWSRNSSKAPGARTSSSWDTVYTYAQRNIVSLKSQLTLGDSTTPSDVFDSIPFRGAQMASDDDMLPESLRGYAPIVRGIARSNAQVTIRQNGYVIYQTYVAPGAFEITDMYPTGGSGDLQVNIKESDGSEQNMVIPYASVPVMQREGRLKYSVTSGVYRAYDSSIEQTPLTQATAIYGLSHGMTLYGGGQFASKYQSLSLGVGKNLGMLGAVSADVTQAWSRQQDSARENGQSWRIRYSKNFVETGTNFAIAGYRYATSGYWGMQEVLDTYRDNHSYPLQERRRNRAEMSLTQSLGKLGGSLALSAVREDYWNSSQTMESYGASYNNSFAGISYGLSYTYNLNSYATGSTGGGSSSKVYSRDQLFSLNLSIPIDKLFGKPTYVSYNMNSSKNGNTSHSAAISGTTLSDDSLSWSVLEGYGTKGQGNNGNVNLDWRATYGEVTGGYGYDQYSQRLNYGVQGGVLVHEDGITLSQPMGETVALVAAPGAKGVAITGQTGVKTDWRGYTVMPYASPFRKNDINLDPETLGEDAEIGITTQTVIPTRGAVVKANYQTSIGNRILMVLTQANGKPVPFGATVSESGSKNTQGFIVGDGGQVYLTGLGQSGTLTVQWGNGSTERCSVSYSLPESKAQSGINQLTAQCR